MRQKSIRKSPLGGGSRRAPRLLNRARALYYLRKYPDDPSKAERAFRASAIPWYLIREIEAEVAELETLRDKLLSESNDKPVFEAFEMLELDALWETQLPEAEETVLEGEERALRVRREIQAAVRRRIQRWRRTARTAQHRADSNAAAHSLERFARLLCVDRRGKRKRAIPNPYALQREYAQQLFRLFRAHSMLSEVASARAPLRRAVVERALGEVGVNPALSAQCFWFDNGGLLSRRMRPLQFIRLVRGWIADRYGVEESTVTNNVSSLRSRRSRK